MADFTHANPFVRRDTHSTQSLWLYKIFSVLSWLLVVVTAFYYTFSDNYRNSIWGEAAVWHTPFTMNSVITSLYWLVTLIGQVGYVWALFSSHAAYVDAAASVGSHFVLSNLLQFAFFMLFVRSHHVWAEVILIVNFFNLSFLYFRHSTHPRFIHVPVVSAPLAWTFVALYWNGALAVHAEDFAARILANVAIWGILVYGLFFLVAFKDYTMGLELSILTAAIGTSQFLVKTIALQWIFAFVIMSVLFVSTLAIAFGKDTMFRKDKSTIFQDQERAPLLDD